MILAVRRSLTDSGVATTEGGDENQAAVGTAFAEATGRKQKRKKSDVSGEEVVVLGSGNLGLVYLMDETRRMTLEEIGKRHPNLIPALRAHPFIGWLLVQSETDGPLVLGPARLAQSHRRRGTARIRSRPSRQNAAAHLSRTNGFAHAPDILVGSFYDPELEQGCAFEELISFHGGLGGPQTRPFILAPSELPFPDEPIVGAAEVHALLTGWRAQLQGDGVAAQGATVPLGSTAAGG